MDWKYYHNKDGDEKRKHDRQEEVMMSMQKGLSSTREEKEKLQQMKFKKEGEVQKNNMHTLISVLSLNYVFAT